MKLSESAIVLRPRGVAEVVDLAFRVVFSFAFPVYVRLALATLLPAFAVVLLLRYAAGFDALMTWGAAIGLAIWLEAPFTIAASRLLFKDDLTTRTALRLLGRRALSYTGALVTKAFFLTLAALPLFIPLFIVGPHAVFVTEASVLEQAKWSEAWTRSKRLVMSRSGDAAGALFSWLTVRVACVLGAELMCQGIIDDLFSAGAPLGKLIEDGVTPYALFGLLASTPITATARFLQYIDTRTRSDGWDIQVRFMAILAREDSNRRVAA